MAPPSPRRPGFSRRAQYSLFGGYVVAIAGLLTGLLLVVTARFDPTGHAALQSAITDIFSPVSSAGRAVVNMAKSGLGKTSAYFDAASKNQAMSDEINRTRRKLIAGDVYALENRRLKSLLALVERLPDHRVTARLISSSGASSRRYATIGAGAADGVKNGQIVRSADGLVGRIIQVGQITSRVLLIIDTGNIVPVKRVSDGFPALAEGLGDGRLDLRPLNAGINPFKVGDIFVTSGTGGIYQPGIAVAIGVKRGRESTIARALADPAALDFAIVEPVLMTPSAPQNPDQAQPK